MRCDDVGLDNCLKCSDCNTVCPVMTAYSAYPGPKHLGPELERLRREGLSCDSDWLEYCLGCDRCSLACPNQVPVSAMIARAKTRHVKPAIRRWRDFLLARPAVLGAVFSVAPALSNAMLGFRPVRRVMAAIAKITDRRSFPPYAAPFRLRKAASSGHSDKPRVLFFPGCSISFNQPGLGQTVLAVLDQAGFDVSVAGAGCCGIPAMGNGDLAQALRCARANVKNLAFAAELGIPVITACTSCGHMLKSGFGEVLAEDADMAAAARHVAAASYDLGEFLLEHWAGEEAAHAPGPPQRLAYHAPCHQLSQGTGRPWFHLLRRLPGVDIVDLNAGCCGMAGTFGFKDEKYPVAMSIGSRLFDAIACRQPEAVVSECPTCRLQIEHGAAIQAIHPVEILRRVMT